MEQQFTIFEFKTLNEEIIQQFHDYFTSNDLTKLFTNEYRASPITVTDLEARSLIKGGNKANRVFKEFRDVLEWASNNKMYESAVFKIIHEPRTFTKMVSMIEELLNYIQSEINVEHLFNMWNIVWYDKESMG